MSIRTLAIAIGESINPSGLYNLVGNSGDVFTIKSYSAITSVMNVLALFFCKLNKTWLTQTYLFPQKGPPCEPVDVIFVIDETTSIKEVE
jgi:hypothetical protein